MNQMLPTPPATQDLNQASDQADTQRTQPTRHPRFYCTNPTLTDGVVIQVCCQFLSLA